MLIRNVVSTLALATLALAPVTSQAASLFGHGTDNHAAITASASKVKMVKFTLANKTSSPMTIVVNDQTMTLAANSATPVRLAEGSDIYGEDHSTLKLHVTGDLSGNTVSFR